MIAYIKEVLSGVGRVFNRFPLAVVMATVATLIVHYLISNVSNEEYYVRIVTALITGVWLTIGAKMLYDKYGGKRWLYQLGAVALTGLWYYLMGYIDVNNEIRYGLRFLVSNLIGFFLVSWLYFWPGDTRDIKSFAKYNISMFYHLLEALITNFIIYLGVILILMALDNLFHIKVPSKLYLKLLVWIMGWFTTVRMMASIPPGYIPDFTENSRLNTIVGKYVLIPFSLIYLAILYAYGIKVIIGNEPTDSWISVLTLWFFGIGILTYLLNYLRAEYDGFAGFYVRWFFPITLPLTLLLLWVSYRNISDQGVTPPNYYTALLTVWLLAMSIYFLVSQRDDLRWIPVSLVLVGLFSIAGPWSFDKVVLRNQYHRLTEALANEGWTPQDLHSTNKIKIKTPQARNAAKWLQRIEAYDYMKSRGEGMEKILDHFYEFAYPYKNAPDDYINIYPKGNEMVDEVSQYDYLVRLFSSGNMEIEVDKNLKISYPNPSNLRLIKSDGTIIPIDFFDKISPSQPNPDPIIVDTVGLKIKVKILTLQGRMDSGKIVDGYGEVKVFIGTQDH